MMNFLHAQPQQLQLDGKPVFLESEQVKIRDSNGNYCAAIRVVSTLGGFQYEATSEIVLITNQPGMDILYLPIDEKVITIFHKDFLPLVINLVEAGIILREREVWQIQVTTVNIEQEIDIRVNTNPAGAIVYVDGNKVNSNGQIKVTPGTHQLRLIKGGYDSVNTSIFVAPDMTDFHFDLKKQELAVLNITSVPDSVEIFINDERIGTTPIKDKQYPLGTYQLRAQLPWYVTYNNIVELSQGKNTKQIILEPDFGTLKISSSPYDSLNIFINNNLRKEKTPFTYERMWPGKYYIKAGSKDYITDEQECIIGRGETIVVNLTPVPYFALLTINSTDDAVVYLNGERQTQLQDIKLVPGMVELRAEFPDSQAVEQQILLAKGDIINVDLFPETELGSINIVTDPSEAEIVLLGENGQSINADQPGLFEHLNSGNYVLIVTHDDYEGFSETIELKNSDNIERNVQLQMKSTLPLITEEKKSNKKWLWIGAGVAAIGGGAAYIMSSGKDETEQATLKISVPKTLD